MNISKLTIGEFIPKRLGMKKITVKRPSNTLTENSLSIASRIQKQEALEAELAQAMKKRTKQTRFNPEHFESLKWQQMGSQDTKTLLKTPIFCEDIIEKRSLK